MNHRTQELLATRYAASPLCLGLAAFLMLQTGGIAWSQSDGVTIDTNFPGGNVIVLNTGSKSSVYYDGVEGDVIEVRPDLRDNDGWWFYWYYRVTGAAGRTLTFKYPSPLISAYGPACSSDDGNTWRWLYDSVTEDQSQFTYTFGPEENSVRFCVAIPYMEMQFKEFVKTVQDNPYFMQSILTRTRSGRDVEQVHISNPNKASRYKVLITARHHACEMMASYAQEGLMLAVLTDTAPEFAWLRENVEFRIVPFMDKDGVEEGDQGKKRRPRDHNRDYSGESIYATTRALRAQVPEWGQGKLRIAFDMHCPGIHGKPSSHIYFVQNDEAKTSEFVRLLVERQQGELVVDPIAALNTLGSNPSATPGYMAQWNAGDSFGRWASKLDGVELATTVELPFANHNGQQVTPENARQLGRDIAGTMSLYLQQLDD